MKRILYAILLSSRLLSSDPVIEEHVQAVVHDVNEFAFDLYKHINPSKNTFFSPYSLFSALAIASLGAKGDTASEMGSALHLSLHQEDLLKAVRSLEERLLPSSEGSDYSLKIANALWIEKDFFILPEYIASIQKGWDTKISSLNFSNAKEASFTINNWVSQATHKHINELLSPNDISSLTKLILTNAIYFQGSWTHLFKTENTKKEAFYTNDQSPVFVDMMEQTHKFPYYENADFQMLLMPMNSDGGPKIDSKSNAKYASFFILPKNRSIETVESHLSSSFFTDVMSSVKPSSINIKLPRFTVKHRFYPKDELSSMGINLAFSNAANFSRINGFSNLKIDTIIHEALFIVNESGATAAAATAISIKTTCAIPFREPSVFFHVNHPFLFGIIDLNSGLVLFLGKMTDL